jgi:uncharacterized coiled-coil protein SlyX
VLAYLVSLFTHHREGMGLLRQILAQQEVLMALVDDLRTQVTQLQATVAAVPDKLSAIAGSLANVAGDVQRLTDAVGAGTPGITPEDAAQAIADLTAINQSVAAASAGLDQVANDLAALAAQTPEPAPPAA